MSVVRKLSFFINYLLDPPWDTQITPPELLDFIKEHPPGNVIDLGCGTGTNVITLAKHGWSAIGVDFISKAIKEASAKARKAGVHAQFFVDDVTKLTNIQRDFDLVLDIGCFHSLSSAEKTAYLFNLRRLIAPDGYFLLYAWRSSEEYKNPGITTEEINLMSSTCKLVDQKEGTERGKRPSVWLLFQRI